MEEALQLAGDVREVVVIGGGGVFRAALPWVNRLYLSFVEGEFAGTAFLPAEIPTPPGFEWRETHREAHPADEKNPHPHEFVVLDRVESPGSAGGTLAVRGLSTTRY